MSTIDENTGLTRLEYEMARQHQDALSSYLGASKVAKQIADSLRSTKCLLLLGMGASHWINRTVAPLYRQANINATAEVASEFIRAPLNRLDRTTILTSQSGASGEIVRYLEQQPHLDNTFGLTMEKESPLGTSVPCLLGHGGPELAFAATRSNLVAFTLHCAILAQLGIATDQLLRLLRSDTPIETTEVEQEIAKNNMAVFVSRGFQQGIAEAGALCLMELGRIPAFSMEAGQFLHGPCEMLGPDISIILLRYKDDDNASFLRIVKNCIEAGMKPIVFDHQDGSDLTGCVVVPLPLTDELTAAAQSLITMQKAIVYAATKKVTDVGRPVRSSKVTNGEVG